MLAAGKLGGLAEEHRGPLVHQHIHRRTHARARPEPRRRVGLATLDADREVLQLHRLAPQLRGPLHEFLGLPRGPTYGLQIPATLYGEGGHRLASLRDAVSYPLRPVLLDPDDDRGCHVGVAPSPDHGP